MHKLIAVLILCGLGWTVTAEPLQSVCKVTVTTVSTSWQDRSISYEVVDCTKDVVFSKGGVEIRALVNPALGVKIRVYYPAHRVEMVIVEPFTGWRLSQ